MKTCLLEQGYMDTPQTMRVLLEHDATSRNIVMGMRWLVEGTLPGDVMFFHFSGHGSQVSDQSGMESDGLNETILPFDYKRSGQITDNQIWDILVANLPDGARMTCVMDSCHSGTGMDLPYTWDDRRGAFVEDVNPCHSRGDVLLFSGCEEGGTSADTYSQFQSGGAMTNAFLQAYRDNPMPLFPDFLNAIRRNLQSKGFKQRFGHSWLHMPPCAFISVVFQLPLLHNGQVHSSFMIVSGRS